MKKQPIRSRIAPLTDAVESALSGAEIYVRDVRVTNIKQLEEALKKLEVKEDDFRRN